MDTNVSNCCELVGFFEEIEGEVVDEEPPAELKKGGVPAPVGRLAGWLDHRFGVGANVLFFGDLVQVRRYQTRHVDTAGGGY